MCRHILQLRTEPHEYLLSNAGVSEDVLADELRQRGRDACEGSQER